MFLKRRAMEQNAAAAADNELVSAVEFWKALLEQEDEPFYPYRYRYRDRPFLSVRSHRDLQVAHAKFDNILTKKMQQLGCSRPDAIAFIESTLPKPKSYKPIYPADSFNFFPPNRYRDFDVADEMIRSKHELALESIYDLFDDLTTNVEILYKADIEKEARKLRSLRLRRFYYTFIPDEDYLENAFRREQIGASVRVNFYPKCPQPHLKLRISPCYPGGITILVDDVESCQSDLPQGYGDIVASDVGCHGRDHVHPEYN
ncbi:flavanone 3-hydroxylase [Artemisia annua]|uniref:Flavanone 3-hydroxylase n=1 Tax=Artemisia annua TaxID=35608 RepID=A0A2U1P0P9_ARTAN|nr:flavanone 3-hydroxylase [Artemisia annua]